MNMTVADAIRLALESFQQGQASRAEQICRQVLAVDSQQVDAWHLLGVILFQQGRKEEAVRHLQEALRQRPDVAQVHFNVGNMLREMGRLAEAVSQFQRCLQLQPNYPEAHGWLGSAYIELGQYAAAVKNLEQAVRLNPKQSRALNSLGVALIRHNRHSEAVPFFERALQVDPALLVAHTNLSLALRELGRMDEAIAHCQRAIDLNPRLLEGHFNLGIVLMAAERYAEAVAAFERAVELSPANAQALCNLGGALYKLGRLEDAVTRLQKATAIAPQNCDALNNLGSALLSLQRYGEAADVLERVVSLEPGRVSAHRERGVALRELGRLDEAIAACQRAVELDPTRFDALKSLGVAYLYKGDIEQSVATFDRALVGRPDHADGRADRAMAYLTAGDFERGFAEYEFRLQAKAFEPRRIDAAPWDGGDLCGRSILVYAEQGLGDSLQFVRYLPLVKRRGGRVLFECPKSLHRILSGFDGIDRFVASGESLPACDVQSPLLSLPHRLGVRQPKDGPQPPYLAADPELVARWRAKLEQLAGCKVGVNWQGSPIHKSDRFRSIALSQFMALAQVPGVRLISLQKGFGREQLHEYEDSQILDLGSQLDVSGGAFMDTAAVLESLDLVITSDTALAHLAGALGKPVWVALSAVPDWRWLTKGDSTDWYPSMRLFRQKSLGDWSTVFAQIAADLQSLVESKAAKSGGKQPIIGISDAVLDGKLALGNEASQD